MTNIINPYRYATGGGGGSKTISGDFSTNLVAHYEMDESSGGALDSTGTHDATTTTVASYNPMSFDGVNDGINLPNLGISGSTNRTVSFWFKTGASTNNMGVVGWGTSSSGTRCQIEVSPGTNRIEVVLVSGRHQWSAGAIDLDDDAWHHGFMVLDGTALNDVDLWLDGTSLSLAATNNNTFNTADSNYGIGWSRPQNGGYFDGEMKRVTFWDTNLDGTDASDIYNSGDGIDYS